MALNFAKKGAAAPPIQNESSPPKTGGVSWLKTGAAAKQAVAQEALKAEARKAAADRLRGFKVPYNGDSQATFLDGLLDADGVLDVPRFFQHKLQVGSSWETFICTGEADQSTPCPLCESGNRAVLVGALTVIDHSKFTVTQGPNAGKVYKNQKRLFIAGEQTLASLQKLAQKPERNGLFLCTFDISRGPESKHPPRVGDTFDFVCKHKSLAAFAEKYGLKVEDVGPADYEQEIVYLPPAKLIELGFGKKHGGVGYEKGVSAAKDDL